MKERQIKAFIEKAKIESTYRKFVNIDIIKEIINIFNNHYEKKNYPSTIDNPVELALQFYKDYNEKYYHMIMGGIENKKIIISKDKPKSFTDTKNNTTFIRLYKNDSDLFILVHEFAHFIDRNSKPQIVPNDYWFLGEVFSFYMEKKLESWLDNKKYKDLISIRINNRIYFEIKMVKAIEYELYYENLYKEKGNLEESDLDIEKVKYIMRYDVSNLINYLLTYPLANILSSHLINNGLMKDDNALVEQCMEVDLYTILKDYSKGN